MWKYEYSLPNPFQVDLLGIERALEVEEAYTRSTLMVAGLSPNPRDGRRRGLRAPTAE
jgi:hypothetical protein